MKGFLPAILTLTALTVSGQTRTSTVVFICPHGAAKSVIAAAYFNKISAERGLPYRAVARGIEPQESFSSVAVKGLASDGLTVTGDKPRAVQSKELRSAARVVTLGASLPAGAVSGKKRLEWNDVPVGDDYAATRDAIVSHVQSLVDGLARPK